GLAGRGRHAGAGRQRRRVRVGLGGRAGGAAPPADREPAARESLRLADDGRRAQLGAGLRRGRAAPRPRRRRRLKRPKTKPTGDKTMEAVSTTRPDNGLLERLFKLREHGTSVRVELVAGLTTFLTMAYIIFVNPSILG